MTNFAEVYKNAKTVSTSTHDLKNGDLVKHYGWLFRLSARTDHGVTRPGHTEEYNGASITFVAECLYSESQPDAVAPIDCGYNTIQGNRLATWSKVA